MKKGKKGMIVALIVLAAVIGYKYFSLQGKTRLTITTRGTAQGMIEVWAEDQKLGAVRLSPSEGWKDSHTEIDFRGVTAIQFRYVGDGRCDFKQFTWEALS